MNIIFMFNKIQTHISNCTSTSFPRAAAICKAVRVSVALYVWLTLFGQQ